jgi:phosphoglycolate phosphatase
MYKAYVFDFDYTLVNSEQGIVMCFEMLLKAEGFPSVSRKKICQTIGKPMTESMSILTGITDKSYILELCRLYKIRYSDKYMTPNTHLFPDTRSTLNKLKNQGTLCGIVSTKTRHRINQTIEREHLDRLVDFVIGIEDVDFPKPTPYGLELVQKRYSLSPQDILYIGDSLIDAQTAQNSHVDFTGVTTGTTTAADFEAYPFVRIIKKLSELV